MWKQEACSGSGRGGGNLDEEGVALMAECMGLKDALEANSPACGDGWAVGRVKEGLRTCPRFGGGLSAQSSGNPVW